MFSAFLVGLGAAGNTTRLAAVAGIWVPGGWAEGFSMYCWYQPRQAREIEESGDDALTQAQPKITNTS